MTIMRRAFTRFYFSLRACASREPRLTWGRLLPVMARCFIKDDSFQYLLALLPMMSTMFERRHMPLLTDLLSGHDLILSASPLVAMKGGRVSKILRMNFASLITPRRRLWKRARYELLLTIVISRMLYEVSLILLKFSQNISEIMVGNRFDEKSVMPPSFH